MPVCACSALLCPTVACQPPLSMEFPMWEYWSWLPRPPTGDLPDPGIKPLSLHWQADSLPSDPPGKPLCLHSKKYFWKIFQFCLLPATDFESLAFKQISVNLKLIKMFQRFYNYFLYTLITFSVIWCLKLSALTYHWIIPFYWAFRYKKIFLYLKAQ